MTSPITASTSNAPTQTPALKIPPTTSHELIKKINKKKIMACRIFLMLRIYGDGVYKNDAKGKCGNVQMCRCADVRIEVQM